MKLLRPLLFGLFFISLSFITKAQEIHYTLFNMSPLTLNPAQTGAFYGTVRVGGIFRSQWWSVDDNIGYETPSFYGDAPIIRGFREQDWVGVGAVIVSDRAGSLNLKNTATFLSAAYHLGLGKKNNSVLTLGVQGGSVQRSFFASRVRTNDLFDTGVGTFTNNGGITQDQVLGGGGGGGGSSQDTRTNSFLDFSTGLMLRSQLDNDSDIEVGVAVSNINTPKDNFSSLSGDFDQDAERKPLRILSHIRYAFPLSDKLTAEPTAMFQTQRGASEFNLQAWGNYLFDAEKDITFKAGLGYRFGDAAKVLIGADIKDIRVAAAFDLNLSGYRTATDYQGGFEIAAWYIIKKYKKPDVKPAILCPRF